MRRTDDTVTIGLVASLLLALLTLASPATAWQADAGVAGPRPLDAEDTLQFRNVGGPTISPDGEWVLYTVATRDMDSDDLERTTQVWRVRVDGTDARQLTRGDSSSSSPRWFPDGDKIAFIAERGDERQVWAMYMDGGEAWQATEHDEAVQSFQITPDGAAIVFQARDPLGEEEELRQQQRDDAVVVDESFRWSHLWAHDVETGEARRLTEGAFTVSDPQVSPDSTRVAYVTRPTTKVDDGWNSDIWVVALAGDEPRKLFENAGSDVAPRWSPDSSTIAFGAKPQTSTNTWYTKLYLVPAEGGEPQILLEDFDLDFSAPIWAPGGQDIFWTVGDRTRTNLYSVQLATGETLAHEPPRGGNFGFSLSPDGGRWVWIHSAPDWPAEIYTAPFGDFSSATALTDVNAWLREEQVKIADVEVVRWRNSDGQEIEGVLHKPLDYEEGRAYPFVVHPHGGPSGAVMTSFNSTNQLLAANGFMVLQPNFRGSSNYGQEFLNANRNYWGIRDYDDIMTGVDHAIEQGWADPDRMVAYGWSYGGYMTFWMSTQTDRFKLISPGAGLSNLYSMYSTTDIPNYLGWFFGTPWDNEDVYRQLSPIRHAKDVTAKILIMHGANDARVPPEQAVEFYRALRDLGKDVSYVSYPRQGHGIAEPRLQLDRLRRYVCAFTDAVGMDATTESCQDGLPMRTMAEEDETADEGAAMSHGGMLDQGVFTVIEPWRR